MPSWRRFSVDKHGTVHVREVFKPHWHGKATPSLKGVISAAQAEKTTRRVSPSRAQRSALRAAHRAQRERAAQVRLRMKGLLEVFSRQWRAKRRDDSQPTAEAPATPAPAPPSTPAHPIGDHDMQDNRGAKRADGETLHPQQPSMNPAKKIKPRTSPAASDAAAVAQPPAAVSPTTNNTSTPTFPTAAYPVLLAALERCDYQETDPGINPVINLPECESDGEFDLRVRELRKIDLQLSGRNYSQGKINATAGGKQSLEREMMLELKKDYRAYQESTK